MKIDKLEIAAALAPGLLLAAVCGIVLGAVAGTLDPAERAALGAMMAPRGALLFLGWMLAAGVLGALSLRLYSQWAGASARLAEAGQSLVTASATRCSRLLNTVLQRWLRMPRKISDCSQNGLLATTNSSLKRTPD